MINRRIFASLIVGASAIASPVLAAERKSFDQAAFAAAQAAGRPIMIDVTASWCPTCKAQAPIIASLAARPEFSRLVIFDVDFDTRKDVLRGLGVQRQSTLIMFRGRTEAGRSVGDTNAASIETLMRKAI